jgi:hypothetical protein
MKEHAKNMANSTGSVPAAAFTQSNDPNIQPTPINIHMGGIPNHWLATQPISRRDMKMNNTPGIGSNPRTNKVLTFNEFVDGIFEPGPSSDK